MTMRSTRGSRIAEEGEDEGAFSMETYGWRGDMVTTGEVEVKGGARSLTSSEEAVMEEKLGKGVGIVKTTHFVVQEDITGPRPSLEQRRWSSI